MEKQELKDLGWCILEIMGHRKLAGQVQEVAIGGGVMLRVDVPSDPPLTQFYGVTSIFCLTPTTEEIARAIGARYAAPPVHRYELVTASGAGEAVGGNNYDGHEED